MKDFQITITVPVDIHTMIDEDERGKHVVCKCVSCGLNGLDLVTLVEDAVMDQHQTHLDELANEMGLDDDDTPPELD